MDLEKSSGWKEHILLWAKDLGFVTVGFTSANLQQALKDLLETREQLGYITPFVDYSVEMRCNPKAFWPECLTVVALAYPLPLSTPSAEGEGIFARSAVGEDYHHILKLKLEALKDLILSHGWPGAEPWYQVDTGPLVERFFAARAGIGWIGRNQQLIIPGYGSFVALGLLLLDQVIPPDHESENQCGTCSLCMEACPAKILDQEQFQAEKCVSCLTQTKTLLTGKETSVIGQRIFGCDTCQEVCPHNRLRLKQEALSNSSYSRGIDPIQILDLSGGEFKKQFSKTAAGWRGKSILQRNAFLALKNAQDKRLEHWIKERVEKQQLPPILKPYLGTPNTSEQRNGDKSS